MIRYNTAVTTTSFYIHWPFCQYKCFFCPFVAFAGHDNYMAAYHDALMQEIEDHLMRVPQQQLLDTIFLGGGTPSIYPDELLLDMFGRLEKYHLLKPGTEITIEVNPGTVRPEQLVLWHGIGINRMSIGVQSLNDQVLKELNRNQSAKDVYTLLERAHAFFSNISIDLILGLPGITEDAWKKLLTEVVTWPITHISVYFLTVYENTALFFKVNQQKIVLPPEEGMVDQYLWTIDFLASHGFEQYETSNFAKAGFASRHNQCYWDYKPYKGFGLGACSFDGNSRFQNEKNLIEYLRKVKGGEDVTTFTEELTSEQRKLEHVMLGMRQMRKGVLVEDLLQGCNHEQQKIILEKIHALSARGLIKEEHGRLLLTSLGLSVQNEIVVQLSS